jgi:FkbM family methyltransferase
VRDRLSDTATWNEFARRSYSQEGEDVLLARIFANQARGTYVDVGAHHPFRFSNTQLLYERGWRGLNIDATAEGIDHFVRHRSRDINVRAAIGSRSGTARLYHFDDPALNTLDDGRAQWLESNTGYRIERVEVVPVRRLDDVLATEGRDVGGVLDLLTIDVETAEFEVLHSLDLDVHRPRVIVLETLGVTASTVSQAPPIRHLVDEGYVVVSFLVHSAVLIEGTDALLGQF